MPNHIIFKTSLSNYKGIVWYGQPVFRQYPKLKNHIKQNLGEEFAVFFAEPHIESEEQRGSTHGYWTSEILTSAAVQLTKLPPGQQAEAKELLQHKVVTLQNYAQKLLESEKTDDNKWGQLILKSVDVPDLSHIMVDGKSVALVAWGFKYCEELPSSSSLKSLIHPITTPKMQYPDSVPMESTEQEVAENPSPIEASQDTIPANNSLQNQENLSREVPAAETNDSVPPPNPEKEIKHPLATGTNTKEGTHSQGPPPPGKSGWWRNRWWMVLLLLLLLLIIFFLIKYCSPKPQYMPKQPGMLLPIDSTKIIQDPDSVAFIVSDRLNIALVGTQKNVFAFADAFKKTYPGNDYQIIYYDTLTYRIQIQVPVAERDIIKRTLPEKLPDFKMLIWYESIFQRNKIPNDPGFDDISMYWYHDIINAPAAWDISQGDTSVIIAVIDDGFDLQHPELSGKFVKPWNIPEHTSNVLGGSKAYHGTHVAGIALGSSDNNAGVAGVAPHCKLMPIQVSDRNGIISTTAIIDAVLYAIHHGANVINMSLGMQMSDQVALFPPSIQKDMIQELFKDEEAFWHELFGIANGKNIAVVLAAGNQNIMVGLDPMQRTKHTISVSAVDPYNHKASFSNYGPLSTISAPGVQIYSSIPQNKYKFLDGTSMAAPIVAGSVALIKSVNPALSFDQIVDLIQTTGIRVNTKADMPVGNLIQLDRALGAASANRAQMPSVDCPDHQKRIDSLLLEIEKIRELCPPGNTSTDTMRMPDNARDLSFAEGRWKSTSYIYNEDGEKVTIYFDFFRSGKGKLTLVEADDTQCIADLNLSVAQNLFRIDQKAEAECPPLPSSYSPYIFECRPDAYGCAECVAQNRIQKNNRFTFRLVKIN